MGEPDFDTPVQIRKAGIRPVAEGHTLLKVLAEKVDGLLAISASESDMILTQGYGRTSGDRSVAWSGLVTNWSCRPTYALLADSTTCGRNLHACAVVERPAP
jgi:hypothetical protein